MSHNQLSMAITSSNLSAFFQSLIAEMQQYPVSLTCRTGVLASVKQHAKALKVFSEGVSERSIFWVDPATGQPCRVRPDYYREDIGVVFALKSTADAGFEAFRRDIFRYGYHISAAMYLDGCGHRGSRRQRSHGLRLRRSRPMPSVSIWPARSCWRRGRLSTGSVCRHTRPAVSKGTGLPTLMTL